MLYLYVINQSHTMRYTIQQIEDITTKVADYFESLGLFVTVSRSRTSFGASNYVCVYRDVDTQAHSKIRISDHACSNSNRITNEYHWVNNAAGRQIIDQIEAKHFPERFTLVDYVNIRNHPNVSPVAANQVDRFSNVVKVDYFTSKKGNPMANVHYYPVSKRIARI